MLESIVWNSRSGRRCKIPSSGVAPEYPRWPEFPVKVERG